jgi:hypothetical protein
LPVKKWNRRSGFIGTPFPSIALAAGARQKSESRRSHASGFEKNLYPSTTY